MDCFNGGSAGEGVMASGAGGSGQAGGRGACPRAGPAQKAARGRWRCTARPQGRRARSAAACRAGGGAARSRCIAGKHK